MLRARARVLAAWIVGLSGSALAQQGDRLGEVQPAPPAELEIPPAPVLAPAEARDAFEVAGGYVVEPVATEPLIHDPVWVDFGPDGSAWVVEMRGFMPDVDGEGEEEPNGRIVVLRDTDGDAVLDESRVFADGLVLPRGVLALPDGALVIAPPRLLFMRDLDGDGRADERREIADGFDEGLVNPEHDGNALTRGIDNWIHLAADPRCFRRTERGWEVRRGFDGGQWGMSRDDWGRLYYDYNSDALRADLIPPHYAVRNPHVGPAPGVNERVLLDQEVWPVRVTPGVNRGYRPGVLDDGRLRRFTAACGPGVYRGHVAPELAGDVFVCEPAANLVRRNVIEEHPDGRVRAHNPYGEREVLASHDERFRPVQCTTAPDGTLWVVDMYRGILQHRNFMTTFLRKQIEERGLDRPVGLGRIWRLRPADGRPAPVPDLTAADPRQLVARLGHPTGTVRDLAQMLLVWRGGREVVPELRALARESGDPRARVHALWTLEGSGALERGDVLRALSDPHPQVRRHAVRLTEAVADPDDPELRSRLRELAGDPDPYVRRQVLLSLGELRAPAWDALLDELARAGCGDPDVRRTVASGLAGRELEHVARLLVDPGFREEQSGRGEYVALLAGAVVAEGVPERVGFLVDLVARAETPWQQEAALAGMVEALDARQRRRGVAVPRRPVALLELRECSTGSLRERVDALLAALRWTDAGVEQTSRPSPQSAAGARIYRVLCAQCHQPDGSGKAGLAPRLAGAERVHGRAQDLVRIVLQGLTGPVEIGGEVQELTMPPVPHLTDEQVAAVLTYVRSAWGNDAPPVDSGTVARIRAATADRIAPWTREELDGPR